MGDWAEDAFFVALVCECINLTCTPDRTTSSILPTTIGLGVGGLAYTYTRKHATQNNLVSTSPPHLPTKSRYCAATGNRIQLKLFNCSHQISRFSKSQNLACKKRAVCVVAIGPWLSQQLGFTVTSTPSTAHTPSGCSFHNTKRKRISNLASWLPTVYKPIYITAKVHLPAT